MPKPRGMRFIGNRVYLQEGRYNTKRKAEEVARSWRGKGKLTRVIKIGYEGRYKGTYEVWRSESTVRR